MSEVVAELTSAMCENACEEIADQPLRAGVVLLGEQPDVVSEAKQSFEQLTGIVLPATQ